MIFRRAASRSRSVPIEVGLAALALAYGALSHRRIPERWHIPANLAAAAGVVGVAHALGASRDDLGLDPRELRRGALVGASTIPATLGVVAVAVSLPATRGLFADDRFAGARKRELAYHGFVRIPLSTAIAEELLFRSALLGTGLHGGPRWRAVLSTSVVFGLWHVLPAARSHEANPRAAELSERAGGRGATVLATTAVTALAGAGLAMLRIRGRSVAAPIVAHAALNGAALLGTAVASRLAKR